MYPILRTRHSTYVGAYKCGRYPAVSFSCFLRLLRRVVADKTKETAARNKQAGTPSSHSFIFLRSR